MKTIVILYALVQLPGVPEPIAYEKQVTSITECLREVKDFLNLPSNVVLQAGGYIQAGCYISIPKAIEH